MTFAAAAAAPAAAADLSGVLPLPASLEKSGSLLFLHPAFHFKIERDGYSSGVLERSLGR